MPREHGTIGPKDKALQTLEADELHKAPLLLEDGLGLDGLAMRCKVVIRSMQVMGVVSEARPLQDVQLSFNYPL